MTHGFADIGQYWDVRGVVITRNVMVGLSDVGIGIGLKRRQRNVVIRCGKQSQETVKITAQLKFIS